MTLSGSSLLLNVHIELERLRVFLSAVLKSGFLALDFVSRNIRMVYLLSFRKIEIRRIIKIQSLGIPRTYMEMLITISVELLTDAGFNESIGLLRSGLLL